MEIDLKNKKPLELLELILNQNSLACRNKNNEAHEFCKKALQEIIGRGYGNISKTFQEMFENGTGPGQSGCIDVFQYASAIRLRKSSDQRLLEEKYDIRQGGVSMEKDGLLYQTI